MISTKVNVTPNFNLLKSREFKFVINPTSVGRVPVKRFPTMQRDEKVRCNKQV